jgi:hypothetical protein
MSPTPPVLSKAHSGAWRPELNGASWRRTRAAVRRRDGNRCAGCGAEGKLSVHHIVAARNGGGDEMANLITLRSRCHARAEARSRRESSNPNWCGFTRVCGEGFPFVSPGNTPDASVKISLRNVSNQATDLGSAHFCPTCLVDP